MTGSSSHNSPSSHRGSQVAQSPFARFKQLEEQAAKSNQGSPLPSPPRPLGVTSLHRNSSLPPSTRPTLAPAPTQPTRSGSTAKEVILTWVQSRLQCYPIPMTNFSSCWNDGLAFCALIHVFYPDSFDWFSLKAENRRENFTLGFDKAEELADITPLLEVDDMVRFHKPDWKCVFTYVQSFYRRFRDVPRPKVSVIRDSCSTPEVTPGEQSVAKVCTEIGSQGNPGENTQSDMETAGAGYDRVKSRTYCED